MDQIADFFNQVDTQLEMPVERRVEVMREVMLHYRDIVEDLLSSGIEESKARQEALTRLGSPREIAGRLNAVHNSASRRSALLCAVPFIGWAICVLMPTRMAMLICGSLLGAALIVGSARELLGGRRPVWLATWFGMSYAGIGNVIRAVWPDGPASPSHVLTITLSAVFIIIAVWNSPRWRWQGLAYSLLSACSAAVLWNDAAWQPLRAVCMILGLVMGIACVLVLALRLFADDRHGSPWRASLFLFALFSSGGMWTTLRLDTGMISTSFLVSGLSVIVFVVASQWRYKVATLAIGMLAKFMLFDAFMNLSHYDNGGIAFDLGSYLAGVLLIGGICTLCALAPMLSERADRGERLTLAR